MYKCLSCGSEFKETSYEHITHEYFGRMIIEAYAVCPVCKSEDIARIQKCKICGKETEYELCKECVEKITDDDIFMEYASHNNDEIKISDLYTCFFTTQEIEEILLSKVKEKDWEKVKKEYIYQDYADYVEWLIEKRR